VLGHARLGGALLLCLGALAVPFLFPAGPAWADGCANEAIRADQGAAAQVLPDCRAYELVSRGSLLPLNSLPGRAAANGNAVAYYTNHPASGASTSGYFYVAERGSEGWSTRSVAPQSEPAALLAGACEQNLYFSPDVRAVAVEEGWFESPETSKCKRVGEPIVVGEPTPYRNVFLHDLTTDSYTLLNAPPAGAEPANAKFQDASDDFSHVVFSEEAKLTPEAPPSYDFYLWTAEDLRLITFLPSGAPVPGELADAVGHNSLIGQSVQGSGFAPISGAVSSDGRSVFFYSGGSLYLRRNADQPQSPVLGGVCTQASLACTVQVDRSRGPGASGGGAFWRADSAASTAFFTDSSRLTPDSNATSERPDLYEYDVSSDQLTDLTAGPEPAGVLGVSGAAEAGSYVYFVADGVLAPAASPGNCASSEASRSCSLYVAHGGSISFIATLGGEDEWSWQASQGDQVHKQDLLAADVSPSGRYFAFTSRQGLAGFDNHDAVNGERDQEIYLYDAAANGGLGQLSCVSCPASGVRPRVDAQGLQTGVNWGNLSNGGTAHWRRNAVLDDGSVFFGSAESLVEGDGDGEADVYLYRAGKTYLISGADFPAPARFLDATPSGSDIFFTTPESLVGADTDEQNTSLYDARAEGGFVEPHDVPEPCAGEACRPPATTPPLPIEVSSSPGERLRRHHKRHRHGHRKRHRRGHGKHQHHAHGNVGGGR